MRAAGVARLGHQASGGTRRFRKAPHVPAAIHQSDESVGRLFERCVTRIAASRASAASHASLRHTHRCVAGIRCVTRIGASQHPLRHTH